MESLGGVFTSLASLAAKLLYGTSSSFPPNEGQCIEEAMNKLIGTLERIRATLYDAEKREIRDQSVKLWLKELRQVARALENVIDEYQYEVLRARVAARDTCTENSYKKENLELTNGLLDQIKETTTRFEEITKDRVAFQLREEDGPRRCDREMQLTPTSHMVVESNIIGRRYEREHLIDLVLSRGDNDDVVSIMSIVGTGGLGKTTLAQLVYNDPRIQHKFDHSGWVCVSEDFSVDRLTRDVVESITRKKCDMKNLSGLQEELKEKIKGKNIFLVLDDVWNEKSGPWELFRTPFLSTKMTKILVTTRNEQVARIIQTLPSYKLGYLSKEQCWKLFRHYAFGGNYVVRWKFEIGKEIMKKCGMLPLAVKSIACLLKHEANEEGWREILESDLWESDSSIEIFPSLQISYSRLPTYLKPCLLYCSMFPKDYIYDVEQLTQLWYAHGYIKSNGRKTIEEVGRKYVEQLSERSFFNDKGYNDGLLSEVKMHDVIHDLALSNSDNECYLIEYGKPPIFPNEIYHLYVEDFGELVKPSQLSSFRNLRTLVVDRQVENCVIIARLLETQALRAIILRFQCCGFGSLDSIGKLKHLRYISLEYFTFENLPESICSLYNLQTLILSKCRNLTELPNGIGNLASLQFLSLSYCSFQRFPESTNYLTNLKALRVNSCNLVELPEYIGDLANLEELVLLYCDITALPVSLCQLESLRKLQLISCCDLNELPCEMGRLKNLKMLMVEGTGISSLPSSLNKLDGVRKLDLMLDVTSSNNHYAIGWLNNTIDLKGTLCFVGLKNITSLADAQHANLMNKHNIECLILCWDLTSFPRDPSILITLIIRNSGNSIPLGNEMDSVLLESLQPHRNIKKLDIQGYRGITFPKFIGNPNSCASLEEVSLEKCTSLTSLPFSKLGNLKHLRISECHGLQFIKAAYLPQQLRKLFIFYCEGLVSVPGIQELKSLAELEIFGCRNLNFLWTGSEIPLAGLRNLTLLQSLTISYCRELQVVADELLPVESCKVAVCACPKLKDWCSQHNFRYSEDPLVRISIQ